MAQSFEKHIDSDRAMELLNAVIDHIAMAENTNTQLKTLFDIGFTADELVNYFSYSQSDIDDYLKSVNDDDDNYDFCNDDDICDDDYDID